MAHKIDQPPAPPAPQATPPPLPVAPAATPATPATTPKVEATLQSKFADFTKTVAAKGVTLTPRTFNSLGLDVTIGVTTSVSDFDKLAGKDGEALDQAVKNIVYRGPLATFRDELCAEVEKLKGVKRKAEYELNDDGTEKLVDGEKVFAGWAESEAKYIKRVAGDNPKQFQDIANNIAKYLTFDPSAPEPKSTGPKTTAKVYLTTAQEIMDRPADGSSGAPASRVHSALQTKYGVQTDFTVEGLAALIKIDQDAKKKLLSKDY